MAIALQSLQDRLKQAFPNAIIHIQDLAGDGDHYALEITDAGFAGKNRVEQHQMVYSALDDLMAGDLHALALKCKIP